jgi:hypothetical protein
VKSPALIFAKLRQAISIIFNLNEKFDEIKINQGKILSTLNENRQSKNIRDYEFKIFSQWGEDGIIQHLSKSIEIANKTFIEFGVETFHESNCRYLLMKDNWSGFVIDGSAENVQTLKDSYFYWKYSIDAIHAFITKENINKLLVQSGFDEDLGILSIDIDGIDYFVLEEISTFRPRILICEYNSVFGNKRKISVPYDSGFKRTSKHYSNLYFGASLPAITYLANKKGYSLVGTNSNGGNAFFLRNDLLNDKIEVLSVEQAYFSSNIRESRDAQGNLTYISGEERLELIRGLPVLNVESNAIETL